MPPRRLSKLSFVNLFTDAEYVGILTAARNNVQIEAWVKKMEMTAVDADGLAINLDDPRTVAGVQALEAAGLIGTGRASQILG